MSRTAMPQRERPDADAAFDAWAQQRVSAARPFSPTSVEKYRSVWAAWHRFLVAQGVSWHSATPALLNAFVDAIDGRGHGQQSGASFVSQRRYWRILNFVYAFAAKQGWVRSNPGTVASANVPRSETCAAVVLPPAYLDHLRANLQLAAADPPPTWQALRDQALLAVLLDAALTTTELCALRVDQVLRYGKTGGLVLRVDGERPAQRRDLLLEPETTAFLRRWLTARQALFAGRADAPTVLFTSQKAPGRLAPKSVFLLLQHLIGELEKAQDSLIAHRGANVIRSSVIAEWLLNGVSVSDALGRAGLDSERALDRLAHGHTPNRPRRPGVTD